MTSNHGPDEYAGRLWLMGVGWALLTLVLLALLGIGLPILMAGALSGAFPRAALPIATVGSAALTVGTMRLLLRETRRRYGAQPRLARALTIGYAVALVLSGPFLLLWFGFCLTVGFRG